MGKNILIAGGGTGGHIYPGFAVAEAVFDINPLARVDFACTSRSMDKRILEKWSGKVFPQTIEPFSVRPFGFLKFYRTWGQSRQQMRHVIRENNISAVLGLGGFGSGPAVYEAHKMGLRTALLNPDFVPGRANQWLGKFSGKVFVQWPGTSRYFNRPVEAVGVPLRKSICELAGTGRTALRQQAQREFELFPDKKTLVIMGGSTGARSLNDALVKVVSQLPSVLAEKWQVLFITGSSDFDRIKLSLVNKGALSIKLLPYCDRMDLAWSVADLAICRAGAITLAELTAAGIPAILLPYPYHRDNHQAKNAQVLVDAVGAVIINDDKVAGPQTTGDLQKHLSAIMLDDNSRQTMSNRAASLGKVDAAKEVARWLMGQ